MSTNSPERRVQQGEKIFSKHLQTKIAERADIDEKVVAAVMAAALVEAVLHLQDRDELRFARLGTLRVHRAPWSIHTNPATGITVEKEGPVRVRFKPARSLRTALANGRLQWRSYRAPDVLSFL